MPTPPLETKLAAPAPTRRPKSGAAKIAARARPVCTRGAWLSAVAVAAAIAACSSSPHEQPDAEIPTGEGGHGASTVDGGGGGGATPDAASGGGASDAAGAAGASEAADAGTPCTNACVMGASRCSSETTLETCGAGANGCTVFAASTCAAGSVCERIAPASCADSNWAEWPMPNSPAEVALGSGTLPQLIEDHDGTVTDGVTDLMWQQDFRKAHDVAAAVAYCAALNLGGHADWRLPSIIELVSLVDFTRTQPSVDATVFPVATDDRFWSSTARVGFADSYYVMEFFRGFMEVNGGDGHLFSHAVRCVR